MEVGAVKQAFNNEVILLKQKLNQAKIQVIHKLTRKAKQLAEKKAPEPLKEKLKRKAESAVKEVLIIKKIKSRDIAKFTVTHKGELKDFLNKPTVDNDKACARLLLHKALQDKYKFIRGRFSNVPIQDLFMSRLERRKAKKEAKEKQKNKRKGKDGTVVNSEGDWNVEDVTIGDKEMHDGDYNDDGKFTDDSLSEEEENELQRKSIITRNVNKEKSSSLESESENSEPEKKEVVEFVKPEVKAPVKNLSKQLENKGKQQKQNIKKPEVAKKNLEKRELTQKNPEKKLKDINKSKNFNEKMQQKKLKKDLDGPVGGNKIVDPFFITSTGENYMSVVEPRGPDEIKDEHKKGNRKLRRAALFGHVPNIKPRQNNNNRENNRFNNQNGYERGNNRPEFSDKKFNNRQDFGDSKSNNRQEFGDRKFNNRQEFGDRKFNNRQGFDDKKFNSKPGFSDSKSFNNDFNVRKNFNVNSNDEKPEKLHPSWEAKKKKSGILPFEGKKIVFE